MHTWTLIAFVLLLQRAAATSTVEVTYQGNALAAETPAGDSGIPGLVRTGGKITAKSLTIVEVPAEGMEHAQDKGIPNIEAEASASLSAKTLVTPYVTKKDEKLREVEVDKEQSNFATTVDGETIEDVDKTEKIVKVAWDVADQESESAVKDVKDAIKEAKDGEWVMRPKVMVDRDGIMENLVSSEEEDSHAVHRQSARAHARVLRSEAQGGESGIEDGGDLEEKSDQGEIAFSEEEDEDDEEVAQQSLRYNSAGACKAHRRRGLPCKKKDNRRRRDPDPGPPCSEQKVRTACCEVRKEQFQKKRRCEYTARPCENWITWYERIPDAISRRTDKAEEENFALGDKVLFPEASTARHCIPALQGKQFKNENGQSSSCEPAAYIMATGQEALAGHCPGDPEQTAQNQGWGDFITCEQADAMCRECVKLHKCDKGAWTQRDGCLDKSCKATKACSFFANKFPKSWHDKMGSGFYRERSHPCKTCEEHVDKCMECVNLKCGIGADAFIEEIGIDDYNPRGITTGGKIAKVAEKVAKDYNEKLTVQGTCIRGVCTQEPGCEHFALESLKDWHLNFVGDVDKMKVCAKSM